jgi:glutathione synthase/RimK-type ligase-like ATP-grasp enzyme
MQSSTVLVFSSSGDVHADRVEQVLQGQCRVIRLNLDAPSSWQLDFVNSDVLIRTENSETFSNEVKSAFLRRTPSIESFFDSVPENLREYRDYIGNQKFALFSDCLSILNRKLFFVNPLESSTILNKGVQQYLARQNGFTTPATYIGSSPSRCREFCDALFRLGEEICTKPVQNLKIHMDGEIKTRFTEKMRPDELEEINSLEFCPLIFQSYIPKKFEIRGTIIGEKVLACRIHSQEATGLTRVDWRRFDIPRTPHYPVELPDDVKSKLIRLHRDLNVHVSHFDLIHTIDDDFVFLETNPFGQWLWIEDLTGLPISKAIAGLLLKGRYGDV